MILKELELCFQSILMTGDGKAGQCEAILSTYVCDIIFEVISCFVSRYGASTSYGEGGVSGLIASLNGANNAILKKTIDRYGDNNVFTNELSASNLAHSACIWAFTGSFPLDWDNLLETGTNMPINSTAFIRPAERRFQTYDVNGKPVYVYDIGYSIFSGSDISYYLELSCEGPGSDCTAGNAADVSKKMNIPSSGKNGCTGRLTSLNKCDDRVFQKVESWVRFNVARLCWQSTNNHAGTQYATTAPSANPEALNGCTDPTEIVEVGAPPGGLCDFDAVQGKMICGIAIGEQDSAFFAEPPKVKANSIFSVGDQIIADFTILQNIPKTQEGNCIGDCKYTKYLEASVWNDANGEIFLGTQRLNGNQRHDLRFYDSGSFPLVKPFTIQPEMFGGGNKGGNCAFTGVDELGLSGSPLPPCSQLFSDSGLLKIEVKDGTVKSYGRIGIEGFDEKDPKKAFTGQISGSECRPSLTADKTRYTCKGQKAGSNFEIKINDITKPGSTIIMWKASSSSQAVACDSKEHEWTLRLSLFVAEQYGSGWKKSSTLALGPDGTKQVQEVKFKTRCSGGSTFEKDNFNNLGSTTATLTKDKPTAFGMTAGNLIEGETITVYDLDKTKYPASFDLKVATLSEAEGKAPYLSINLDQLGVQGKNYDLKYNDGTGVKEVPACSAGVRPSGFTDLPCKQPGVGEYRINLEDRRERLYTFVAQQGEATPDTSGATPIVPITCTGDDKSCNGKNVGESVYGSAKCIVQAGTKDTCVLSLTPQCDASLADCKNIAIYSASTTQPPKICTPKSDAQIDSSGFIACQLT